jgi:hypothetical protein
MRRATGTLLAVAVVAAGCGGQPGGDVTAGGAELPRCGELPRIEAPADAYRDEPVYVANEMPIEEVGAWARQQQGFEELWIDREHNGWITLAFSEDAQERRAEVAERFPDDGVVVVEVDWTMAELEALQQRVMDELAPAMDVASGIDVVHGVVGISVGVLTEERVAAVTDRFAGERVCLDGIDPGEAPPEGQQATTGDGWRLLAAEPGVGEPYRTGIATDEASYRELWRTIGLAGDPPEVDLDAEVVIWFGAVFGSSCPDLRFDDVVVDRDAGLVHAEIVLVDPPPACTDDANPYAFLVAVERGRLPVGPFAIQLGAEDPPPGAPEERTLVEVDLTEPGAVAAAADVHDDPDLPPEPIVTSGDVIEPGYPAHYRLSVHCGIEWLGELNGVLWRTDVPPDSVDHVPAGWQPSVDDQERLLVELVLATDPPTLTATANGVSVVYEPATGSRPGCW